MRLKIKFPENFHIATLHFSKKSGLFNILLNIHMISVPNNIVSFLASLFNISPKNNPIKHAEKEGFGRR